MNILHEKNLWLEGEIEFTLEKKNQWYNRDNDSYNYRECVSAMLNYPNGMLWI